MFWISFAIFMVTTVIYVLWASGEVQPWNNPVEYYAARNNTLAEAGKQLDLTNGDKQQNSEKYETK